MPRRSTTHQRLVAAMQASISPGAWVEESCLLRDRVTGQEREVDVVVRTVAAGIPITIAIEVTERSRSADVSWVEEMNTKHQHLSATNLVLVSASGFTKAAREKALWLGMEAVAIEDACELDWAAAARLYGDGILRVTNLEWKCYLHLDGQAEFYCPGTRDFVFSVAGQQSISIGEMCRYFVGLPGATESIVSHFREHGLDDYLIEIANPGVCIRLDDNEIANVLRVVLEIKVASTDTPVSVATRRYLGCGFVAGQSNCAETDLVFVLRKDGDGKPYGTLNEGGRLRALLHSE